MTLKFIFTNLFPLEQHHHLHWFKPVSHSQVQDTCGSPREGKRVAVGGTLDAKHSAPGIIWASNNFHFLIWRNFFWMDVEGHKRMRMDRQTLKYWCRWLHSKSLDSISLNSNVFFRSVYFYYFFRNKFNPMKEGWQCKHEDKVRFWNRITILQRSNNLQNM